MDTRLAVIPLVVLCAVASAWAADKVFAPTSDSNWNTPGNWTPSGAPGAGDTAIFDGTSGSSCVINAAPTVQGVVFNTAGAFSLAWNNTTSYGFHIGAGGISVNPATPAEITFNSGVYMYMDTNAVWDVATGSTLLFGPPNAAGRAYLRDYTLEKTGRGTVRLMCNTTTDGTPFALTITAGTFEWSHSQATVTSQIRQLAGSGTLSLATLPGSSLMLYAHTPQVFSGNVVGTGSFEKTGASSLAMEGTGTFGAAHYVSRAGTSDFNYTIAATTRFANAPTLRALGGTIRFNGSDDADFNETNLGQLSAADANYPIYEAAITTLRVTHGAGRTATVNFANTAAIPQDDYRWIRFQGNDLGAASKILFPSTAVNSQGILGPNYVVTDTSNATADYAVFDATAGVIALGMTGRGTSVNVNNSSANVAIDAAETLTANREVNTVRIAGNVGVDLAGYTLKTDGIMQVGADNPTGIYGGTITYPGGATTYSPFIYTESDLTIGATITTGGSARIAKAGPGTLTIAGPITGNATPYFNIAEGGFDWETDQNMNAWAPTKSQANSLTTFIKGGSGTFYVIYGWLNVSDKVHVKSGVLQLNMPPDFYNLGNASTIGSGTLQVDAGATLWMMGGNATGYLGPELLTGHGTIVANTVVTGGPTNRKTLRADGIWKPGVGGAGILTVDGHLSMLTTTAGRTPGVVIEVPGSAGVAGTSFDRLAVLGNATLTGADLTIDLPIPSVNCRPAELATKMMDIVTIGGTRTGVLNAATLSAATSSFWTMDADAVVYGVSGANVTLDGSKLHWNAVTGDANLDTHVNISDLTVLANNYGKVGTYTWLHGDFNLDGILNVSDLTLMANNYGKYSDDVVPEPTTLGLLALGALGVVRRRRGR